MKNRTLIALLASMILLMSVFLPVILGGSSVQAAAALQSGEDQIYAALEEANRVLGGGFSWDDPFSSQAYAAQYRVNRAPDNYSFTPPDGSDPDFWTLPEELWILLVDDFPCFSWYYSWEFHGMQACYSAGEDGLMTTIWWMPEDSLNIDGYSLAFAVYGTGTLQGTEPALVLAEALHAAAIQNGLYQNGDFGTEGDLPTGDSTDYDQDWEVTYSEDEEQPFDVPLVIVIGSLGIPVVGAIAGSVLSAVLSGGAAAVSSSAVPGAAVGTAKMQIGSKNEQGLYWSERPWDEAGPGYVSKDEYLRTKSFLDRGYRWTNQGWQSTDQIDQVRQWEQKDREAVARDDGNWRLSQDDQRRALEEQKQELARKQQELDQRQLDLDLMDLKSDFKSINQNLLDQNVYVLNPYQGDPTVIFHRLNTAKNMVWDETVGRLTGDRGLTCEGYVNETKQKVYDLVGERFPGSKVQRVIFEEKSTKRPKKNLGNFLDSLVDDNHILFKVTLPDGSELALDFHQFNAGNADLLQPWSKAEGDWSKYMGDEFSQRIYHTQKVGPKK